VSPCTRSLSRRIHKLLHKTTKRREGEKEKSISCQHAGCKKALISNTQELEKLQNGKRERERERKGKHHRVVWLYPKKFAWFQLSFCFRSFFSIHSWIRSTHPQLPACFSSRYECVCEIAAAGVVVVFVVISF